MDSREWDLAISPQSLVDQVNAEGEAWGLRAEYDPEAQRVFVCEVRPGCDVQDGLGDASGEQLRRLCSVTDVNPFSAVLANRIQPDELIGAQRGRVARHDAKVEKQRAADSEAQLHEFKAATKVRRNGGAIFWGGMNRDLEQYRRARRVREEMRRRGMT